jgi:hypothetical protein
MFTDIVSAEFNERHRASRRSAWSRTNSPIGSTSPVSSASGRNSSGESKPRSGCCHRTSASNPVTTEGSSSDTFGW